MKKILIWAIALRLLVAGLLFHPDIKIYNFQSSFLKRGVLNIYSYLSENKKTLPFKEEFVYFPLTYFVVGGYQWVAAPVLGKNFDSWLANASSNSFVRDPNIFRYLITLKIPYLILDILIAFLLKRFFYDKKQAEKAFIFWLFNPFTIFVIYAFSNIDIYAVLLTVVAFLLLNSNKLLLASGIIGLAAGFKLYPVLLIPFLIFKARDVREKFLVTIIPILILGLIILPFWSSAFIQSALVSGLTTRIFNPGFSIGFNESAIVSLLAISVLFFYAWVIDKQVNLMNYWVVVLFSIFAFSHFHVAWLIWVAPFIVILAIKNKKLSLPLFLLATIAMIIPMLYQDRSMTVSLFRIYTTWYDLLPTPFTLVEKFYDPYNLQSILHTVLAGGLIVIGVKLFTKEESK